MPFLRYFSMSAPSKILIRTHKAIPEELSSIALPSLSCTIPSATFICCKSYHLELTPYMQMLAQQQIAGSGSITYPQPLNIAYIDTNIQLLSILSGLNNLKLAAEYHQTYKQKQIHRRALQLLAYFQCTHVRYKLPAFMSTLEHRLLLIARALMLEPDILFIDKPFQGLDMHEHNILGDHLMTITTDMQITVVSSAVSLAFMKKAAQQIIYCDDQAFYAYNEWGRFRRHHPELFEH